MEQISKNEIARLFRQGKAFEFVRKSSSDPDLLYGKDKDGVEKAFGSGAKREAHEPEMWVADTVEYELIKRGTKGYLVPKAS
jgi:hypothetical protein